MEIRKEAPDLRPKAIGRFFVMASTLPRLAGLNAQQSALDPEYLIGGR